MMQICANWGINLSKGGKCRICIPTPVLIGMQIKHLPPLLRFIPQMHKVEANLFFRPVFNGRLVGKPAPVAEKTAVFIK